MKKNIKNIKKALKNAGIVSPAILSTTVNASGHGGYNPTVDYSPDRACVLRILLKGGVDLCDPYDLPGTDQILINGAE